MLQALEKNDEILPTFRTIGEISLELGIEPHVIRYWETQFTQIKPLKRRGGRRYYRAVDVENIEKIHLLLHIKGYTIKGAKKFLNLENQAFMVKSAKPDTNTIDMFGAPPPAIEPEKPKKIRVENTQEKEVLRKVLESLKEIQKLVSQ